MAGNYTVRYLFGSGTSGRCCLPDPLDANEASSVGQRRSQ
jgi:hypothetical protein